MMKGRRLLMIMLFASSGLTSKAQDAYDRYTNFFSVELGTTASSSGVGASPLFSVYRSGHKIDVGLNLILYDAWKAGPGLIGTYLGYKYYPNQRKHDFNLYFGYHTLFTMHDWGKRVPEVYDLLTDESKYPVYKFQNEHLIGIGFDYQMGNRIYMVCDFSVGAVLEWSRYQNAPTEMEIRSTGMVRLGLGYNIGHKKAK